MNSTISELTKKYDHAQKEAFGWIAMYQAKAVVGLFSGGHDSLLSTHIVSQHPQFKGVIFADTGTGTGETIQYILDTCLRLNWSLERQSVHPMLYESLIVKYGFPSPHTHHMMYKELKGHSIGKGLTAYGQKANTTRPHIAQITGMRMQESSRRMIFVKPYNERRAKNGYLKEFLINPIWDWSQVERDDMINHLNLPRNAYADKIGHSYECMCYANVGRGEREQRAKMSPVYEEIEQKREQMVALALEIQALKFEAGMIDKKLLLDRAAVQGWHLDVAISEPKVMSEDSFNLCAPCMSKRASDGTGGYDPDAMLSEAKAAALGKGD